jgi:hypothetical protein
VLLTPGKGPSKSEKISSSLLANKGKEHYTKNNGIICHTRTYVCEKMMESFFAAC